MTSWIWGPSAFDEGVEKATSELNVAGTEDIALNLELSDQIRSKSVNPKEAMRSIKRRLNHQNPNVQLLALYLVDLCVKNGGDHFLVEIASREFIDNLVSILKVPSVNREVREKSLKLVQTWAGGFEGKQGLSYVGEVYKQLGREGFKFPPKDNIEANSAMVDTSTAPEWIDSDVCLRCRTAFSFTNRKHHCRNCGQVFDQACSSKTLPLPHFGIPTEVRVCDTCFVKLKMKSEKPQSDTKHRRSQSHGHARNTARKSARELADEELQRAIQLSLEESKPQYGRPGYVPASSSSWPGASEPPVTDQKSDPQRRVDSSSPEQEEDDPELRAAIEASLREYQAPKASAPVDEDGSQETESGLDLYPLESDAIMMFSQTVEEAQARGTRDLVRYPGVGELHDRADRLRPKLALSLDDTSRKEQILSDMHEKLSEAVKLYDRLLTEQVNPARRYNQYLQQQQQRQQQQRPFQASTAYAGPISSGTGYQPQLDRPTSQIVEVSQGSERPLALAPVQEYSQNYPNIHQQSLASMYHQQPQQPPQPQRQFSYSQQAAGPSPVLTSSPPPQTQYTTTSNYQPISLPPSTPSYPMSYQTQARPSMISPPPPLHSHVYSSPPPPTPVAHASPPSSSQYAPVQTPSQQSVQINTNTLSFQHQQPLQYYSAPTPTPNSHPNTQSASTLAQSPYQQPLAPLPNFPIAPTVAPFTFTPATSTITEQSQPKEAMLISFD